MGQFEKLPNYEEVNQKCIFFSNEIISLDIKIVSIIAGACLKHSDSGESSFNKEARVILMELENVGYEVVKKQ